MDYRKLHISEIISGENFNYKLIINFLSDNPDYVQKFIDYSLSGKKNAWRATWILYHYSNRHGISQLQPFATDYINLIKKNKIDGYIRETIKIVNQLELNEEQTCEFYDICLELLWNNKMQPSVRSVAFEFLLKTANKYPELQNEIFEVFSQIKEHLSNGIKQSLTNRIANYKIKKQLN